MKISADCWLYSIFKLIEKMTLLDVNKKMSIHSTHTHTHKPQWKQNLLVYAMDNVGCGWDVIS